MSMFVKILILCLLAGGIAVALVALVKRTDKQEKIALSIVLALLVLAEGYFAVSLIEIPDTTPDETTETTPAPPVIIDPDSYFAAVVEENDYVIAAPYAGEATLPDSLAGVYYSAEAPGGAPLKDGTGKIWLKLTPKERKKITELQIDGVYSSYEALGNDLYCIYGVGSDLTVRVTVKNLSFTGKEMLADVGYGLDEDGRLVVRWIPTEEDPLRYVELSYKKELLTETLFVDAALGEYVFEEPVTADTFAFSLRAISYERVGKKIDREICPMEEAKSVAFPRVEITTENFIWPSFDVVHSPDKYWGSGITNALYQQCTVTIFDAANQVVYDSTTKVSEADAFLGARIKVRGNTSASHADNEKYPYKIKLSVKEDLLKPLIGRPNDGKEYADKDWLLLNYGEEGYRIGGDAIADAVGTAWSPDYCYVTLYVNGDYRGLYVLSEAVQQGNGSGAKQARVPVDKTGFVFECDAYWWNEDLYFNTPMTENTAMFFTFKHPDSDTITAESPEYKYIRDYMIAFEEALQREDDSYLDYIDLDSFAKWLLVSDYLCISDGGGANIFLYKKDATPGSKVFLGPNWDFDSWMSDVEGLSTIRLYWSTCPFYIPYLLRKDSFAERYKELYYETRDSLEAYVDAAYAKIDHEAHNALLDLEKERFGTKAKSLEEVKEEFKTWLDQHVAWMETQLN